MVQHPDDDEASFDGLMCFDTVPPPAGAAPDVHSARTTVAELPDSFLDSLKSGVKADVAMRPTAQALRWRELCVSLAQSPPIAREEQNEPDDYPNAFGKADEPVTTRRALPFDLAPEAAVTTRKALAFELPREVAAAYLPRPVAPMPEFFQKTTAEFVDSSPAIDLASALAAALDAPPQPFDSSASARYALSPPDRIYTPPPAMAFDRFPEVDDFTFPEVESALACDDARPPAFAFRDLLFATAAVLIVSAMAILMWMLLLRYLA